jgi:DNA-binding MarR family transcriptional regulator
MSGDSDSRDVLRTPCLCNSLRQASRAVSRLYDDELRPLGLRTTQFTLLNVLAFSGELRQGDLGTRLLIDETTLTRNLRPLIAAGWVSVRSGADRRERHVEITSLGREQLSAARPAWKRAQKRMKDLLPDGLWKELLRTLPDVARAAAGG